MEIIDNFLSEDDARLIEETMLGNNFGWYITPILSEIENDPYGKEFTHAFYKDGEINSDWWNILDPIMNKINPHLLVRVRAALMPRNPMQLENAWHVDYDFPCTTAIYYVNTNNGYTKFEDGTIVESVANRFVSFDSQMKHTGTYATDTNFRCLINFNYF